MHWDGTSEYLVSYSTTKNQVAMTLGEVSKTNSLLVKCNDFHYQLSLL